MRFQCHMRVCVLWLAAKVWVLIGSLVLIIGLFSTGLLKLQPNSTAWLPIRTDSLASITFCVQFLFLLSHRELSNCFTFLSFLLCCLFLNQGCMDVCGISLTCPLVSVNQRNVCLLCIASLFPNAFSRDEKATWPFFFFKLQTLWSLDHLHALLVVCPLVLCLQTLTEIKLEVLTPCWDSLWKC